MNTLLIPCFNRPEFLWHCLDNLTKADGIKDIHTIFSPDSGHHIDIPHVIDQFKDRLGSYEILKVEPLRSSEAGRRAKQSSNVLNGYKYAASKSSGLVFMVEEDIMVARDFFKYHKAIHEKEPDIFCSLSTVNHNREVTVTDDPEAYYLTGPDYCSLGVCFRKEIIEDLLVPHIGRAYFLQMVNYCALMFPHSVLGAGFSEQDGLIRRIQEAHPELPIAYPHRPRAFHSGYYGYNRTTPPRGSTESKIAIVARIIYDREAMRLVSLGPAYYADSIPQDLNTPQWKELRKEQPPQLD